MDIFLNYFISLSLISISCNGLKDNISTNYNNCLTWKDTKTALFLTCRVGNFDEPVTFSHAKSNTRVKCYMQDENRHCVPAEKKITMDESDSSVTIVLEVKKTLQNQDGEWRCTQDENVQTTEVSLSKGIIIDSWVELRGKASHLENKTRIITLECSSCRKPQGLYAEYFADNKTIGSVYQDKKGRCMHRGTLCSRETCSCTKIANAFLYKVRIEISKPFINYSCELHFIDKFRGGKFSITASHQYMGKDFAVTENETYILKNNTVIANNRPHSDIVSSVTPDAGGDKITSKTDGNTNKLTRRKDFTVVTGFLISVCICVIIAVLVAVWIYKKYRAIKRLGTFHSKRVCFKRGNERGDETTALVSNEVECSPCSKKEDSTPAEIFCVDCFLYYCKNCFSGHDEYPVLSSHSHVESKLVPKSFSISIFNCSCGDSKNKVVAFFCKKHREFVCGKCKTSIHSKCKTKQLQPNENEIGQLNDKMSKLLKENKSFEDELDSIKTFLCHGMQRFEIEFGVVNDTIVRTFNENNFQIETDNRKIDGIKDADRSKEAESVLNELKEIKKRYQNDKNDVMANVTKWCAVLDDQKEVYKFLSNNGGTNHLMTAGYYFRMQISEMKKDLNEVQHRCYKLKLQLDMKNEKILVKSDFLFGNKTGILLNDLDERSSGHHTQIEADCRPDEPKFD